MFYLLYGIFYPLSIQSKKIFTTNNTKNVKSWRIGRLTHIFDTQKTNEKTVIDIGIFK